MKAPEQITKVGLQIQKLNCVGLQIRRNWIQIRNDGKEKKAESKSEKRGG